MFCDKCGAKYDDDSRFCSGCGAARKERPIWQAAGEQMKDDKSFTTGEHIVGNPVIGEEQLTRAPYVEGATTNPPPATQKKSPLMKVLLAGVFIVAFIVAFLISYRLFSPGGDTTNNGNDESSILELEEITFDQVDERETGTPQIIGGWRLTSSPIPDFIEGMEHGWMYDEYFYENGTGISYWFVPESGWIEATRWTWETSGGQLSQTMTWFNEEIFLAIWGVEVVNAMRDGIGELTTSTYSISNNILTITVEGITKTYEKSQETSPQIDDTTQDPSQIIGEWIAITIPVEPYITSMQQGWEYAIYFLEDGSGIDWWYSPTTGWHQSYHFTWIASSGQLTITLTWVNEEVVEHYMGSEDADALVRAIGQPVVYSYNIEGDILEMTIYGITAIYERY